MNRSIFSLFAAMVAISFVSAVDAVGPTFDIVGIKIGTGEDNAIAALKAHNPNLYLSQPSRRIEGISEPVRSFASGMMTSTETVDGETVTLLFTMPPSRKVLWGIQRITNYLVPHRPSTDATFAALRAKYGPENVPTNPGSTANLAWVFDANGNLMAPDAARNAWIHCTALLQGHFGTNDTPSFEDIQYGLRGDSPIANSILLVTASVQSTQAQPGSPSVVYNLTVTINDGRIYGPAIEATRAQTLQAVKARQKKENNDVNKRGAPSL